MITFPCQIYKADWSVAGRICDSRDELIAEMYRLADGDLHLDGIPGCENASGFEDLTDDQIETWFGVVRNDQIVAYHGDDEEEPAP